MTPMMKRALDAIRAYMAEHGGVAPNYDELRVALNLSTKSRISAILKSLQQRGLIDYLPGRSRSIRLLVEVPPPTAIATWSDADLRRVASNIADVQAKRYLDGLDAAIATARPQA